MVIKKLRFLDKIGGKTMTWDELNKKYPEARNLFKRHDCKWI